MNRKTQVVVALMLGAALCAPLAAQKKSRKNVTVDNDMQHISQPKVREDAQFYDFFDMSIFEQVQQGFDARRWFGKRAAVNVNAQDEVPDSSWFTNRNGMRRMSPDEVRRGANAGNGPDMSRWSITGRKGSGIAPGFRIKDASGTIYFIKFDMAEWDEMATGAEIVTNQLYYAAGYNTPEIFIVYVRPEIIALGDDARVVDATTGSTRPMTQKDLDGMLGRARRRPDGTYRAIAKKLLPGKPVGPFNFHGLRKDDANDWIPHEHRRDLRGLRVITAWLNDNDVRERNTLDMYVTENGRSFLRHYLIDAGSALGSDTLFANKDYVGFEYILDWGQVSQSLIGLGSYEGWWHGHQRVRYKSVGYFESDTFEPGKWRQNYPLVAFENMGTADAYWAAKIVMAFSDEQIRAAVAAGDYSDAGAADYLARTLIARRDKTGRYGYEKTGALDNFRIGRTGTPACLPSAPTACGPALIFDDLLVQAGFAEPRDREYRYRVLDGKRAGAWCDPHGAATAVPLDSRRADVSVELQARTTAAAWSPTVSVWLGRSAEGWQVLGWSRDSD